MVRCFSIQQQDCTGSLSVDFLFLIDFWNVEAAADTRQVDNGVFKTSYASRWCFCDANNRSNSDPAAQRNRMHNSRLSILLLLRECGGQYLQFTSDVYNLVEPHDAKRGWKLQQEESRAVAEIPWKEARGVEVMKCCIIYFLLRSIITPCLFIPSYRSSSLLGWWLSAIFAPDHLSFLLSGFSDHPCQSQLRCLNIRNLPPVSAFLGP